ncbi:DMT family transporter [Hoeflea sp.]|uniref:DMT family transporter n=1 Tax=Hoeflea sp. TaxID=1940281 RepID=UPI003B02C6C1
MNQAVPATDGSSGYGRGVLFVLTAGIIWSTVGLGVRLIEDASHWQILLYRSLTVTPFLFAVLWIRSRGHPLAVIRQAGPSAAFAGLCLFFAYAGGIYAIQATTVASALLIFASAPMFAALLGWLALGERVRTATAIAILFAVLGVGIMVAEGFSSGNLEGNLAAIGSALGFAVYTVILRYGRARDMMPSAFLSGFITLCLTIPICIGLGLPLVISANDASIALSMGVFQIGAGLVLYTIGSKTVPSAELTLLSLGEVLLAPVWVWMYMAEVPSPHTLLGGAVLLAAIVGNAVTGMRRRAAPVAATEN